MPLEWRQVRKTAKTNLPTDFESVSLGSEGIRVAYVAFLLPLDRVGQNIHNPFLLLRSKVPNRQSNQSVRLGVDDME
jgi:hypothetical protein